MPRERRRRSWCAGVTPWPATSPTNWRSAMNPRMDPRRAKCFLVVMDPGWGKSKMEHIFYNYRDALEACAEDQQKRPNTKYHLIWGPDAVSYTHLRAHETGRKLVCRL